jgi:hypothetical protein
MYGRDLPAQGAHATAQSTGTANVQTLTPPSGAVSAILTVRTNGGFFRLDGTSPTTANGFFIPPNWPLEIPVSRAIRFVSGIAGNCDVTVLWLTA